MSLRDQLVAKGFASKKDAKRANRDLKQKRKKGQGKKRRQHKVEQEQAAAEAAAFEARLQERARGRKLRDGERAEMERKLRVQRIVLDSRVRSRGKTRFHFKKLDGRHIAFISVSEKVAVALRAGHAAIAAVRSEVEGAAEDYWVIPAAKANKLRELEPELVVFQVEDTAGIGAADERFLDPDWEISLGPHRVS